MNNKPASKGLALGIAAILTLALFAGNWMGLFSGSQKSRLASQLELKGNNYVRATAPLLFEINSCYWLAQQSAVDHSVAGALKDKLDSTELLLKKVEAAEQSLGKDLQFTKDALARRQRADATYAALQDLWRIFREGCNNPRGSGLDVTYEKLATQVSSIITHATDTSGMTLDDTLDSYYLINATTAELPHVYETLAQMAGRATTVLSRGRLAAADRTDFQLEVAGVDDACDRVFSGIQTATEENQNSSEKSSTLGTRSGVQGLTAPLKEFTDSADTTVHLLQRMSADNDGNWKEWTDAVTRQNDAAEKLFNAASGELDGLLQAKASYWGSQRTMEWGGAAAVAAGIWALAFMAGKAPAPAVAEVKIKRTTSFEELKEEPAPAKKGGVKTKMDAKGAPKTPDNLIFSGVNSHSMIVEIMQLGHRLRKTGKLVLKSDDYSFNIYFDRGRVVHADSNRFMRGEPSFQMSIRMSSGTYQFYEEQEQEVEQTINGNTDHLIMEAVRLMDENHVIEPLGKSK